MQTFLPYPDFTQSLASLDRARLGKQRVEAKQILLALTQPDYGWQSHPAVLMWRGFEPALATYGRICCEVWQDRGYTDSLWDWFYFREADEAATMPPWLNNPAFHSSHRSNLLRKDPIWYGRYGWTESPDLPYVWPTQLKEYS
jgi:hypothetical protein